MTRRPVEAPVGAFIVRADHAKPFTVRLLDSGREFLTEIEEPAAVQGDCPWLNGPARG